MPFSDYIIHVLMLFVKGFTLAKSDETCYNTHRQIYTVGGCPPLSYEGGDSVEVVYLILAIVLFVALEKLIKSIKK